MERSANRTAASSTVLTQVMNEAQVCFVRMCTEGAGTSKEYSRKESVRVPKLVIKTTLCAHLVALFSSMGRESPTPGSGLPVLRQKQNGYRADCLEMGLLREVQGRMTWQSLLYFPLFGLPSPAEFA